MKKITVNAYDKSWPKLFEAERQRILDALGHNVIEVYHVGSTSVPGLAAKPKIDIIAEVHETLKTVEQLSHVGYQYRGGWNIPGKYGFTKRGELNFNLHVFPKNHPEISCNLLFRDYLRENQDVRDTYAALKQQLAQDPNMMIRNQEALSFYQYTIEKSAFVEEILDKLGYDVPRLLKPVTKSQRDYIAQNTSEEGAILCLKGTKICGYAVVSNAIVIHLDPQYEKYRETYLVMIDQFFN